MERGLRAKTNIIEDASTIDIKELFDKMGIEMTDETTQTLTKLSKEWDSFSAIASAQNKYPESTVI